MKIKDGGSVEMVARDLSSPNGVKKIVEITANPSMDGEIIELWINSSLSCLTHDEALALIKELQKAYVEAMKIKAQREISFNKEV